MSRPARFLTVSALAVIALGVTGCGGGTPTPARPQSDARPSAGSFMDDEESRRMQANDAAYEQYGRWLSSPEGARVQSENNAAAMRSGASAAVDWRQAQDNARAQQSRDLEATGVRPGMGEMRRRPTALASAIGQASSPETVWAVAWAVQAMSE
jgi:hypothetical protein